MVDKLLGPPIVDLFDVGPPRVAVTTNRPNRGDRSFAAAPGWPLFTAPSAEHLDWEGHFIPWGTVFLAHRCAWLPGEDAESQWYCARTRSRTWCTRDRPARPIADPNQKDRPGQPPALLAVPDDTGPWDFDPAEARRVDDVIDHAGSRWGNRDTWDLPGATPNHTAWHCGYCHRTICPWCARRGQVVASGLAPERVPASGRVPCGGCRSFMRFVDALPAPVAAGWVCANAALPDARACPFTRATARGHAVDPRDLAGLPPDAVHRATEFGAIRADCQSRDDEPTGRDLFGGGRQGAGPERCFVEPQGGADRPLFIYSGTIYFSPRQLVRQQVAAWDQCNAFFTKPCRFVTAGMHRAKPVRDIMILIAGQYLGDRGLWRQVVVFWNDNRCGPKRPSSTPATAPPPEPAPSPSTAP